MKKLLLILCILTGFVCASAQDSALPSDTVASRLDKRCPMDFNDGMTLRGVTLQDSAFLFDYIISDDLYANVEKLGGILHDSIVAEMISSPDPDIKNLIVVCCRDKINVMHKYNNSANQFFIITVTPDDLQ